MVAPPIRVLVVDDVEDEFLLTARQLGRIPGIECEVEWVAEAGRAVERMAANAHDVYLVDFILSGDAGADSGADVVRAAAQRGCDGPCIVLTAQGDRDADLSAMGAGAVDFLVKGRLDPAMLERAIRYAMERHRTRRLLAEHVAELRRTNGELAQFASMLSHDMRQPLHVVAGYLELIATMGEESARAADFAVRAQGAVHRMNTMIDDLLADVRGERAAGPFAPVDTAEIFDNALADLSLAISSAAAVVERGPLPVVKGNASQLGQLFRNLLDNALKFRGLLPPYVLVTAQAADGGWVFSVADNGVGVAGQDVHRIFSMFQRGGRGATVLGTGVGLAVCRRVAERHGGRIWVDSPEGGGAIFRFHLKA